MNYFQKKLFYVYKQRNQYNIILSHMIFLSFPLIFSVSFFSSDYFIYITPIFLAITSLTIFAIFKYKKYKYLNFKTRESLDDLHILITESLLKIKNTNSEYIDQIREIFKAYEKVKNKNEKDYLNFCLIKMMPLIKNTDIILNNPKNIMIAEFILSAHETIVNHINIDSNKEIELLQFDKLWYDSYNKKVKERELMQKENGGFSDLLK